MTTGRDLRRFARHAKRRVLAVQRQLRWARQPAGLNPFVYQAIRAGDRKVDVPKPRIAVPLAEQYGQFGDDLIALALLASNRFRATGHHRASYDFQDVRYLEIGANHPIATSATYLLSMRGARGSLVEANPDLVEVLRHVRTRDEVFNEAVVDDHRESASLFISSASELSSLLEESPLRWNELHPIQKTMSVPAVNINRLLERYWRQHSDGAFHFLSLDVEGMDLRLIQAADWRRFPFDVVQVEPGESLAPGNLSRLCTHMESFGYELAAVSYVNVFFVRQARG